MAALFIRNFGRVLRRQRSTRYSSFTCPYEHPGKYPRYQPGIQNRSAGRHDELLVGASYYCTDLSSAMSGAELIGEVLTLPIRDMGFPTVRHPEIMVSQTNRYETKALYVQDQATYGRFHLLGLCD